MLHEIDCDTKGKKAEGHQETKQTQLLNYLKRREALRDLFLQGSRSAL